MTTPGDGSHRASWTDIPEPVRTALEKLLGGAVQRTGPSPRGFSPGFAGRLDLDSGDRYFVKAIAASLTPRGPQTYRREAAIAASLPTTCPTPRLFATYDDGEWVGLIFEYIDGREPDPTNAADMAAVLDAVDMLSRSTRHTSIKVPRLVEVWAEDFKSWRTIGAQNRPEGLDTYGSWVDEHVEQLANLESRWSIGVDCNNLLHGDLRVDNMILADAGVFFVDWPEACRGSSWVDLVFMLPSMAMLEGGPDPESVIRSHPLTRDVPKAQLDAVLAAIAGFFTTRSLLAPPPGLPTVRSFQRSQAVSALSWLRRRLE